jgi:hypothetical protein
MTSRSDVRCFLLGSSTGILRAGYRDSSVARGDESTQDYVEHLSPI